MLRTTRQTLAAAFALTLAGSTAAAAQGGRS
jgi:hypothetical protein